WAGTVLDHEHPVVVIADPGRETESATRLGRIGFDNIVGYLQDGLGAGASRPELLRSTERLSPEVAAERIQYGALALDVRAPGERAAGSVAGSSLIPLSQLSARLGELPHDRPIVVFCAGGYRSSIAASLLQRQGFASVQEIAGGMAAWQ